MKLKKILLTVLFSIWGLHRILAADSDGLATAVYDFSDIGGHGNTYGGKATALITAALTTETNLVLVERSDLIHPLQEQALGASGLVGSDTAARIGQMTGAKVLVTGEVLHLGDGTLVLVANLIGTETGRLFATQVKGPTDKFVDLTGELSRHIADRIRAESAQFVVEKGPSGDWLQRLLSRVTGTNRPTVNVQIHWTRGTQFPTEAANTEMGRILERAGFTVVEAHGERRPDVFISGTCDVGHPAKRGDLVDCNANVDLKVQDRRTGRIIALDREISQAIGVGVNTAQNAALVKAMDGLAERIIPELTQ